MTMHTVCGGCYPRIPMRRPKAYLPGQGGSGRPNPDGPQQDYLLCKTTGSFQRCRDRIRSSLSSRDTVVIQLGLLPCKPTRTPSCNPAPRVYKGSRGTSLEHPRSDLITHRSHTTIASSNPRAHPSTGITQPQTGRRVLPPAEGPNLSKLCVPFERLVLPSHL